MMELQSENGYRWNRTSVTFRHFCVCRRREMVIFREKSVHLVECCESYGIRILMIQTGEREEVLDITVRPDRIESLAQILVGGGVTPCTLREVVEDWL